MQKESLGNFWVEGTSYVYQPEIGSVYIVRVEIKCNNTDQRVKYHFNYRSYFMRKKKIYEGRKKNILERYLLARARV